MKRKPKMSAHLNGAYTYVPLEQMFIDDHGYEAVFGNSFVRVFCFYFLHEMIAAHQSVKINEVVQLTKRRYGVAVSAEMENTIHSLVSNGYAQIENEFVRTNYGDWIIEKRHKRKASAQKAAKAKWNNAKSGKQTKLETTKNTKKNAVEQKTQAKPRRTSVEQARLFYRENINDDVLYEALCEHLEVRQAKKIPNTNGALKRLITRLKELSKGDVQLATAIVDKSIRSGWADVFEITTDKQQKSTYNDIYNQLKAKYTA